MGMGLLSHRCLKGCAPPSTTSVPHTCAAEGHHPDSHQVDGIGLPAAEELQPHIADADKEQWPQGEEIACGWEMEVRDGGHSAGLCRGAQGPPLTHRDPGVQAQQLHQRVVEDDGHQGHQDVGEAHIEDDGGPCGEADDGEWKGLAPLEAAPSYSRFLGAWEVLLETYLGIYGVDSPHR